MKLLSVNRDTKGRQLICDDAVFDPSLILSIKTDAEEKVLKFRYDFTECGHPLNLPFVAQTVDFLLRFTKHEIHICALVEACDEIDKQYEDFIGTLGEIEFDVRMTAEEKYSLLLALFSEIAFIK